MKRIILILCAVPLLLTSCYNTRVAVGDAQPREPMVKVNSVWNNHLLGGLIPLNNARMQAKDYVGEEKDYIVRTNQTFLNGLVGFFTLGIYTPTTTTYYIPVKR